MISDNNKDERRENNQMQQGNGEGKRINLGLVREALKEKEMTQAEFAILARSEAKRLGLWRATKVSKPQISRFLSDTLPKSQVHAAILAAVEKYLDVTELFVVESDHDA